MNRLEFTWALVTPLSHIGETKSADTFLAKMPLPQADGEYKDIFIYSGNAIRGQMRDNVIFYLIDLLEINEKSINPVNHDFLFSSGSIGGSAIFSPQAIEEMGKVYPLFNVFGGNLNNMMMPGTFSVSDAAPVCLEALHYLRKYKEIKSETSFFNLICERSFSRHDDSKHSKFLMPDEIATDKKPIQMRYTNQLLNAGVVLKSEIIVKGGTDDLGFGAFCSALEQFKKWPFIGGMHNKGFGQVTLDITLNNKAFYSTNQKCSNEYKERLKRYTDYMAGENKTAFMDKFITK